MHVATCQAGGCDPVAPVAADVIVHQRALEPVCALKQCPMHTKVVYRVHTEKLAHPALGHCKKHGEHACYQVTVTCCMQQTLRQSRPRSSAR